MTMDEMLENIDFTGEIISETWIPAYFPEKHEEFKGLRSTIMTLKESYVEEFLIKIPKKTGVDPEYDSLLLAVMNLQFENALTWGNKRDQYLPITFQIYIGNEGCVLSIEDSGDGFDYKTYFQQGGVRAENTGRGGNIMRHCSSDMSIWPEGKGNIVNTMLKRGYSLRSYYEKQYAKNDLVLEDDDFEAILDDIKKRRSQELTTN